MSIITSYKKNQAAFIKWAKLISLNTVFPILQSAAFIHLFIDAYFIILEQAS